MFAYLDNSATTRPCPEAVAAMVEALETGWGNPSSLYRFGMDAAHRLKAARDQVAKALGAEPDRVFFTSGGTEADNWAIFSAMSRMGKRGRHVITTAVEHHAVLNPMRRLEEQGFEVTYLKPDALGRVCLDALREAIRPDTVLVSVMMVNNESGAVMPIGAMAKLTHRLAPNAIFHTDAVQGEGVALVGDRRPHLGGIGLEALRRTAEAAGPGDQLQRAGGRRHAAHAQGRRQNTGYRPPAETAGAGLFPSLRQPLQNGVHAPVKALRNWAVLPPGPLF